MSEIIFTTIHGSHLYGMAGPHSDVDTYTVTTSRNRARHRVEETDAVTIGFDSFLEYAFSGSHQSVEALFSQEKVWASEDMRRRFEPMLNGYLIGGRDVLAKYRRTVKSFSHADDFKRRRHACRLWLNLQSLRWEGRFDPRMTPTEISWATDLAESQIDGPSLWLLLQQGSGALGDFLREMPVDDVSR